MRPSLASVQANLGSFHMVVTKTSGRAREPHTVLSLDTRLLSSVGNPRQGERPLVVTICTWLAIRASVNSGK